MGGDDPPCSEPARHAQSWNGTVQGASNEFPPADRPQMLVPVLWLPRHGRDAASRWSACRPLGRRSLAPWPADGSTVGDDRPPDVVPARVDRRQRVPALHHGLGGLVDPRGWPPALGRLRPDADRGQGVSKHVCRHRSCSGSSVMSVFELMVWGATWWFLGKVDPAPGPTWTRPMAGRRPGKPGRSARRSGKRRRVEANSRREPGRLSPA